MSDGSVMQDILKSQCTWALRHTLLQAFIAFVLLAFVYIDAAWAEDIDTNPEADEFQQEVERTAAEYEDAKARLAQAEKDVADNTVQIESISEQIPEQQRRGENAARELYKMGNQRSGLISLLLNSNNFYDLLVNLDYIARISSAHTSELMRLSEMKADLEQHQAALEKAQADAKKDAAEAKKALENAQKVREDAQLRAQEEAKRQAEEAAAAQAAAEEEARKAAETAEAEAEEKKQQEAKSEKSADAEKSEDSQGEEPENEGGNEAKPEEGESEKSAKNESKASEQPEEEGNAAPDEGNPTDDGANWSDDQAAFISEWSGRINAYLAGSALDGQGESFAKAAWTYGVDPRWSPAIAFTESTLGANCFYPYNAWGWGDASWSSWSEAIDAHVRGLARGYGYTISIENAQKYCPPNWENWYNTTLDQMNRI